MFQRIRQIKNILVEITEHAHSVTRAKGRGGYQHIAQGRQHTEIVGHMLSQHAHILHVIYIDIAIGDALVQLRHCTQLVGRPRLQNLQRGAGSNGVLDAAQHTAPVGVVRRRFQVTQARHEDFAVRVIDKTTFRRKYAQLIFPTGQLVQVL